MKRLAALLMCLTMVLTACQNRPEINPVEEQPIPETESAEKPSTPVDPQQTEPDLPDTVAEIRLSDETILVDGAAVTQDPAQAVYTAHDIVYYPTGQDHTFGEGTEADAHEAAEAERHTVVHISRPGVYRMTGTLSAGQIAVDLGEGAEEDPNAVVTLILDGVDLTCTVAPAVIFYNVYECGSLDDPKAQVDTTAAGANVVLADGALNTVRGSYVARIYKPDTVELSEDGTEVLDAKKLHKYDAAFYSRMSMNIDGTDGILNIEAENEGLDSELHLTINGGDIRIVSGNDGINTNEDGVSVTTINGGSVEIRVSGETGEGDGIDSNGWLVINGGVVKAAACAFSGDAGIDSDLGIYLNGGTVMASGHMLDRIAGGDQTYAVFTFARQQPGGSVYALKDAAGATVKECSPANAFSVLILAGDLAPEGTYTFWREGEQLAASAGQEAGEGVFGGQPQPGMEHPEEMESPEDHKHPEGGNRPEDMVPPEGAEPPVGFEPPDPITPPTGFGRPGGGPGRKPDDLSALFTITPGGVYFSYVTEYTE